MCFNNPKIYTIEYISWAIKYLISLMHGATMKKDIFHLWRKLLENDFITSLWIIYNTQCDMSVCLIYKICIIRNLNSSANCVSLKAFLKYELGIFVLCNNTEDRNKKKYFSSCMSLWLEALVKAMLFSKHKHTKSLKVMLFSKHKHTKSLNVRLLMVTFHETYLDLLRNLIVSSLLQNVEMLKEKVSLQNQN